MYVSLTAADGGRSSPPGRVGTGFAVRPSPQLLTAVDVVWIGSGIDIAGFHAGAEYAIRDQFFIRAGAFGSTEDSTGTRDQGATLGGGLVIGQHLQVDLAYVTAHSRVVVSSGVRF